jgi:DoxX-like family
MEAAVRVAPSTTVTNANVSRAAFISGWFVSGFASAFMLMDGTMKLLRVAAVTEGTAKLGYPASSILPLGIVVLICTALYLVPRTAVLGAILLTGYLGGAVATHVRVGDPLFSHVLFPTYLGAMFWLGLYLRDTRVRALVPFRTAA